MISKYAIVDKSGTVTAIALWDGGAGVKMAIGDTEIWSGANMVPLNSSECVVGAHWDGQNFTLPQGPIIVSGN